MKSNLLLCVLCALLCASFAPGQIVFGEEKAKPANPDEVKQEVKQEAADPAIEAWVQTLAKRIADQNGVIRASAASALTAVGTPAVPTLKKIADTDGPASNEARRIIAQIERRGQGTATGGRGPGAGPGAGRGRGPDPEAQAKALKDKGFTDEQVKKIEEVNKSQQEKAAELRQQMQNGELTREEMMEARRTMREERDKQLKEALGEDAFKKYQEVQQQMGGQRRGRGGRGGRGGGDG